MLKALKQVLISHSDRCEDILSKVIIIINNVVFILLFLLSLILTQLLPENSYKPYH